MLKKLVNARSAMEAFINTTASIVSQGKKVQAKTREAKSGSDGQVGDGLAEQLEEAVKKQRLAESKFEAIAAKSVGVQPAIRQLIESSGTMNELIKQIEPAKGKKHGREK